LLGTGARYGVVGHYAVRGQSSRRPGCELGGKLIFNCEPLAGVGESVGKARMRETTVTCARLCLHLIHCDAESRPPVQLELDCVCPLSFDCPCLRPRPPHSHCPSPLPRVRLAYRPWQRPRAKYLDARLEPPAAIRGRVINTAALRVLQLPVPMRLCVAEDPQLPRYPGPPCQALASSAAQAHTRHFATLLRRPPRRLAVACRSGSEVILPMSINAR